MSSFLSYVFIHLKTESTKSTPRAWSSAALLWLKAVSGVVHLCFCLHWWTRSCCADVCAKSEQEDDLCPVHPPDKLHPVISFFFGEEGFRLCIRGYLLLWIIVSGYVNPRCILKLFLWKHVWCGNSPILPISRGTSAVWSCWPLLKAGFQVWNVRTVACVKPPNLKGRIRASSVGWANAENKHGNEEILALWNFWNISKPIHKQQYCLW